MCMLELLLTRDDLRGESSGPNCRLEGFCTHAMEELERQARISLAGTLHTLSHRLPEAFSSTDQQSSRFSSLIKLWTASRASSCSTNDAQACTDMAATLDACTTYCACISVLLCHTLSFFFRLQQKPQRRDLKRRVMPRWK